jgi:hypothetical protein
LETELALVKQAAKLFEEGVRPKATYPVIAELASQGFSGQAVLPHPRRGWGAGARERSAADGA